MENQIFKSEAFGEIRVAGASEEPMFCLADICRVLELRVDGVIPRLREGGYNRIVVTDSLGRKQKTNNKSHPKRMALFLLQRYVCNYRYNLLSLLYKLKLYDKVKKLF